jgi:hypothetical protein
MGETGGVGLKPSNLQRHCLGRPSRRLSSVLSSTKGGDLQIRFHTPLSGEEMWGVKTGTIKTLVASHPLLYSADRSAAATIVRLRLPTVA